jgi:hypothetical protein
MAENGEQYWSGLARPEKSVIGHEMTNQPAFKTEPLPATVPYSGLPDCRPS